MKAFVTGDVETLPSQDAKKTGENRSAEQEMLAMNERLRLANQDLEDRIAERNEQLARQGLELRSVNAELAAFSHSVSHNLRAPLRAIGGYARLIEDRGAGQLPDEAIDYLHKLISNAAMMGQLIDGLLDLSRTQRSTLVVEQLDMVALVRECWEVLAESRSGRVIGLKVEKLPPAEGDRKLIYQVWLNLLQNAIKYTSTRAQARINVSAVVSNGVTKYRVEDNGVGFDMRYAHKIGQVFQRLHDGSDYPGIGIGMARVHRILLRHGGILTVHGEPGIGARMEFSVKAEQ